jgi:hypothetical protein
VRRGMKVLVERGAFAWLVIDADVALNGPMPVVMPDVRVHLPTPGTRSHPRTRLRHQLATIPTGEEHLVVVGANRTYKAQAARRYPGFEWRHERVSIEAGRQSGAWNVYARRVA